MPGCAPWVILSWLAVAASPALSCVVQVDMGQHEGALELSSPGDCVASTGCTLWPAAQTLADFLLLNRTSAGGGGPSAEANADPDPRETGTLRFLGHSGTSRHLEGASDPPGQSLREHAVLELGAGLGAVGSALVRRRAAWRVAQTDLPPMLNLLRTNAAKAAVGTAASSGARAGAGAGAAGAEAAGGAETEAEAEAEAEVFALPWGRPLAAAPLAFLRAARAAGRPLLVLGSDLIEGEGSVRPLVQVRCCGGAVCNSVAALVYSSSVRPRAAPRSAAQVL